MINAYNHTAQCCWAMGKIR